ncbi:MAG TPA: hydroxymethylglutaryl-CoA lyase [Phycisphaerales bacterium]|nr:hydroxymethylglutaryl-CoA lyase [Phycisphaerales bacterium]
MHGHVRITDVSPRDGLQNEPGIIPTADKARLVELLCRTGVDEIEVSSFVPAPWIPQLGDAAELFALLAGNRGDAPLFSALVPNERGMRALLEVNARAGKGLIGKASVFAAASETFCRKNTNGSIDEVLARFPPVIALAKANGLAVRGYVSCAVACPFEGPVAPARAAEVSRRLADLGVDEIDLGDTIGAATPESTRALLEAHAGIGPSITLHLHDTFGRAALCVREALACGVRSFDGAAGGLGGCPYAGSAGRRAPGNIDTRALVNAVREAGYACGVDDDRLAEAAAFARSLRGKGAA